MERAEQRRILEALILGAPEPIPASRLAEIVPRAKAAQVRELVEELNGEYIRQGRAFEIREVGGGYRLRTLAEFAPYLQQTLKTRPLRLSQAALETLSIVAYRQPVTRAEVEHVRGVDAGPVLRGLVERKLVRLAGHREVAGRPMLYATTKRFLEVFELARLEDLPTLRDLRELAPEGVLPEAVAEGSSGELADGAEPAEEVSDAAAPAASAEADAGELRGAEAGASAGEPEQASRAPRPDPPEAPPHGRFAFPPE
jgi:segregation and condensation protein B